MKMKKTSVLAFVLLVAASLSAAEVEQPVARQAALHFAASLSTLRSAQDVQLVYTAGDGSHGGGMRAAGYPLFYIYNIGEGNGFVIVAGDDQVYPVLGYADTGLFAAEGMPGNLTYWLSCYEAEIAASIASGYQCMPEIREAWLQVLDGTLQAPVLRASLTTATWNQLAPYNDLCPTYMGTTTYTGCVATAMAIVMRYHQWPAKGTGSFNYLTETRKIPVSVSLGDTYTWGNMLPAYLSSAGGGRKWSDEQGAEVARLMLHAAAACYTDFDVLSSAAYTHEAYYTLLNNFGYDTGCYLASRDLYSSAEWHTLLQSELDAGRPLFYAGVTALNEGHQFILDGYSSADYYHVNWGWSGQGNGYFRLTGLDPNNPTGKGYTYDQSALIGLQKPVEGSQPRYEFHFYYHEQLPFLGLRTDDPIITAGKPFSLYSSLLADFGFREFTGYFSVCLADSTGNLKEVLEDLTLWELDRGMALADLEGDTYTITSSVAEGDVIQVMYSLDAKHWIKVKGVPGAVTELPVGVSLVSNETPQVVQSVTLAASDVYAEIVLRADAPLTWRDVRLFDLSGQLLKTFRPASGETQLTLSVADLPVGIYLLTVRTDNGISRFKIRKK